MQTFAATAVAALALAACDAPRSYTTEELGAFYEVVSDGSGRATVEAVFIHGPVDGFDIVALDPGDEVTAHHAGLASVLAIDDRNHYEAVFEGVGDGAGVWTLDLTRDHQASAAGATVSMPAGFEVLTPASDASFSRDAEITLTWDPPVPGGTIRIEIDSPGVCAWGRVDDLPDTGSATLPVGSVFGEGMCANATITLVRFAEGAMPSALGGHFWAYQRRSITFTSTP